MKKGWYGLALAVVVGSLAACGGGGGGGDTNGNVNPNPDAGLATVASAAPVMRFEDAKLSVTSIEGTQGTVDGFIGLSYSGTRNVLYWMEDPKGYVVDAQTNPAGTDRIYSHFVLSDALPPGEYDTEVSVSSCEADDRDEDCLPGAPIGTNKVPVHYVVKPNIHVVESVSLQRTGIEPAPSKTVTVDVPSEAGNVDASLATSTPDAIHVVYAGGQLAITTTQVRAGNYTATVVLQGSADKAYRRSVQVNYTVLAPAGGEHDLSVDKPSSSVQLQQGQSASVRVKVTRPTWTTAWQAPELRQSGSLFSFRDLGNDEYEISVNTANALPTSYSGALRFNAGTPAGYVLAQFYVDVNQAFSVGVGPQGFLIGGLYLTPATTDAAFTQSYPVVTFDGVPAKWSATSNAAWAKLLTSSGTTGVDQIVVQIDKASAVNAPKGLSAEIEVTIDRPGTLPIRRGVSVTNELPRLARVVNGPLVGGSGRIYLDGYFPDAQTNLNGMLTISGAQLSAKAIVQDTRMLSETKLLVLDVTQATPGQPITVALSSPLLTTQVQVPVLDGAATPGGYTALPYGRYRPVHYSSALHALYFAGEGMAFRWAHGDTAWSLSQTSAPDLIDVSPSAQADALYGLIGRNVVKLDPVTLATMATGLFDRYAQSDSWNEFDPAAPSNMSALSFASDGRAFASLISQGTYWAGMHGVAAIRGRLADVVGQGGELANDPGEDEPGQRLRSFPSWPGIGSGIVRSAGGEVILAQDPDGILWFYRTSARQWSSQAQLPVNAKVAAVDDQGAVVITTDGVLRGGSVVSTTSLGNLLPEAYSAGGYGVTRDGNVALVYGYRIATEGGSPRARDATIWVIDLRALKGGATELPASAVLGRVPLQDAVGCTASLAQGESCNHQASLSVSPSAQNVFVLGPRGLASVQIPSGWLNGGASAPAAAGAGTMARAASLRVGAPASRKSSLTRRHVANASAR